MRSIYGKILVWFIASVVATLAAFLATSFFLAARPPGPGGFGDRAFRMHTNEARLAYESGGPEALRAYFGRLETYFPDRHFLVDARGRDLADGQDRSDLLGRARLGSWPPRPGKELVLAWPSEVGDYRLIILLNPWPEPRTFLPYYLWILVVVAVLCYVLAVHLAGPIRRLRDIVERFGEGEMKARALSNRKDEIGDLTRSFNRMADRVETLLDAERRLLQDVSHELRSPLARLRFAIELGRTGEDTELAWGRVTREVVLLTELVGELIDLTRAEGDPGNRVSEVFSLDDLLAEILSDGLVEADSRGITLRYVAEERSFVQGQRNLLRRVFENVLRNALRYAPPGTEVSIVRRREGPLAVVEIRDQGPGVPEEMLGAIFDPFIRVEEDRGRSSGGVGLGLSIARRALELHGGSISAENAHPGLRVSIRLPGSGPLPVVQG